MSTDIARRPRLGALTVEYRVVVAMLIWLGLLALASPLVSLPLFTESSAAAPIVYGHAMFLHGLLIGMVGLLALIAMDVFACQHHGLRALVLWGTLGATVLSGVGGLFDHSVHDTVALWMQVLSFLFLDEILITLTLGLVIRARATGRLVPALAALASFSALLAAVMGHIAGWMLEFGAWPPVLGAYAKFIGVTPATWQGFLITSHSHEMVVAVLALVSATTVAAFTDWQRGDLPLWTRIGLWDVLAGTALMTIIYVAAGFTQAQPPLLFAFGPHGVNGIAGDDLVTGLGVMLGGAVALGALALARLDDVPARWVSAALSAMLLVTVVAAGYYIELTETVFGAGAAAPGARSDAVFTFWHQDFAFFIVPGVMIVLTIVHRMVPDLARRARIAWLIGGGAAVSFLGGLAYVFLAPSRFGPAFWCTAVGFAALAVALAWTVVALVGGSTPQAAELRRAS
jgi:hypothetical protein